LVSTAVTVRVSPTTISVALLERVIAAVYALHGPSLAEGVGVAIIGTPSGVSVAVVPAVGVTWSDATLLSSIGCAQGEIAQYR
jgi:hypothetical protein